MNETFGRLTLKPAYWFVCPACGKDSYAKDVPVEVTDEDRREQPEAFADAATGDWVTMPDDVTCQHCGEHFDLEPAISDDYDLDGE